MNFTPNTHCVTPVPSHRPAIALCLLLFASGCDADFSKTPEAASGDTTIRFVVCNNPESECWVTARFKHIASCVQYKEFADLACNRNANPAELVCKPVSGPSPTSYCTK
jgi:hypothetical protein